VDKQVDKVVDKVDKVDKKFWTEVDKTAGGQKYI